MRCFHPIEVRKWQGPDGNKSKTNSYQMVPCGHCVACLARRRNDWTYRLKKEQEGSSYAFFLSLTYDDKNIPVSSRDGLLYYVFNKKDVQDYIKRVRYDIHQLSYKLRCNYLAVSEYGGISKRPHYHMQFFVHGDDSLKYQKCVRMIFSKQWTNGFVCVKPSSISNIHYITKYCVKSLDQAEEGTIEDTFVLASKRPYLGICAESTLEKQPFSQPVVFMNGMRQAMPRIYRQKLGFAGCNVPESALDPRFSASGYADAEREYRRMHDHFDQLEFSDWLQKRLYRYEKDAIRRQLQRNEKL